MLRRLKITFIIGVYLFAVVLPLAAQTATPEPGSLVVVAGSVDLQSGSIMVNGYRIAPASAFQPAILSQGDEVIILGNLLPNQQVIQAVSFEFFAATPEATPEVTPEVTLQPTVEVTPQPTAEVTIEPTVEVTPEAIIELTPEPQTCDNPDHPVATALAESFGVSDAEIIGWHCAGFGFGEIARAYLLADASGVAVQTYFDQKSSGRGWGQIVREAGVHPSSLAPGQVLRHGNHPETTDEAALPSNHGQGNGNGNGGGNGNGAGGGNGVGNGNGQGNGAGGNGNRNN